ncbi:MAG: metallophosphatase family protein [Rhodospirillales bacterium]|nr:metallophosphatase family protein [Rhodospirillales bacterium]
MKFALYSDIHAQVPQLEAVQAAVDKENVDKEIVIGDLIMLGPEPEVVVENIRNRPNCDVVVGNLDLWAVNKRWETHKPKSPHQAWMFDMTKQTRDRLSEDQLKWLGMLPFSLSYMPEPGHEFLIFHGTPHEIGDESALPLRLTDDEVKDQLGNVSAEIMAHGHIHGPSVRKVGNQTIVCAAAVGMSWDGDPRPAYATVEYLGNGKWDAQVHRVEFDCEEQAKHNENCWIEHGDRIAGMIRTGTFWNPEHMPH